MIANVLTGVILPNLAVTAADSAMGQGGYVIGASAPTTGPALANVPTFGSSVTVWNPAWILIAIVGIWFLASKGGRK